MSGFAPLSRPQLRAIAENQFQASLIAAGVQLTEQPDTGPDSIMGALFDALSAEAEQLQFQAVTDQDVSRLLTTPANVDGTVSLDAASYAAPFGITPALGANASSQSFHLNLGSLSGSSITVPCGLIIQRNDGIQYLVIADVGQSDYNGSQGYTIPPSTPFLSVTAVCLTPGTTGNVLTPANATWSIYSGPGSIIAPMVANVTNAAVINNGTNQEQQTAFIERFTLSQQNGQWGVETAIVAKALGVQAGLTVSYGDYVNANGTYHPAFFTMVVNVAGSATAPAGSLITAIQAALLPVRAGGIEYLVVPPTLVAPVFTGNVAVFSGFNHVAVGAAVAAAVQKATNAIGLNQGRAFWDGTAISGGTTTLSYAQTLALMIGVPGVNPVGTTLAVNATTLDITAPFASQIVCPTLPTFTTS